MREADTFAVELYHLRLESPAQRRFVDARTGCLVEQLERRMGESRHSEEQLSLAGRQRLEPFVHHLTKRRGKVELTSRPGHGSGAVEPSRQLEREERVAFRDLAQPAHDRAREWAAEARLEQPVKSPDTQRRRAEVL